MMPEHGITRQIIQRPKRVAGKEKNEWKQEEKRKSRRRKEIIIGSIPTGIFI